MKKLELLKVRKKFEELRVEEKKGNIFRDKGGLEPQALGSILKMRILKKIRSYKRTNGLSNKELASILELNESQISKMMAIHFDSFSLDFLVDKLDKLADRDEEIFRSREILKLSC